MSSFSLANPEMWSAAIVAVPGSDQDTPKGLCPYALELSLITG